MIPLRHSHDVGLAQAAVVADIKMPIESRAAAAAVGALISVLLIAALTPMKSGPAQLDGVPTDAPASTAPAMTVDARPPASVIPGP